MTPCQWKWYEIWRTIQLALLYITCCIVFPPHIYCFICYSNGILKWYSPFITENKNQFKWYAIIKYIQLICDPWIECWKGFKWVVCNHGYIGLFFFMASIILRNSSSHLKMNPNCDPSKCNHKLTACQLLN